MYHYGSVTVAEVRRNRFARPAQVRHDAKLTIMFVDHRDQKFVGNKCPPETSFARVNSAAHQPITEGHHLHSYPPFLHTGKRGLVEGVALLFFFDERTSR